MSIDILWTSNLHNFATIHHKDSVGDRDPISISDIKAVIKHLKERGLGVLITDHNVRETLDICERAYIVSDGKVIADGDAVSILQNETVRQVYLGQDFRL